MALDRKGIRLALLTALQERLTAASAGIKEFRSKDLAQKEVAPTRLPVLVLLADGGPVEASERAQPPKWHLQYEVWVHLHVDSAEKDPDGRRDELASAIEAALERQPAEDDNGWWTTLGGKVSRAFISGEVEYYGDGVADPFIAVMVPVEVIVPTTRRGRP